MNSYKTNKRSKKAGIHENPAVSLSDYIGRLTDSSIPHIRMLE